MENMGNKKLALLYILNILKAQSDIDHPLTQSEIAEKLASEFGVVLERKAISRNLSLLREAGCEIESTAKGVYLDENQFDNSELRLMIDGVLSSRYITEKQAKSLAGRIAGLSNKYFRSHVKHIHLLSDYEKTENNTVFYTIALIDEAIEAGLQISFSYYYFDEDLKLTKSRRITVSPIQMVVKNQYYYLIACETFGIFGSLAAEKGGAGVYPSIESFRLDLLCDPVIEEAKATIDVEKLRSYGEEPDPKDFLRTHPYMHSGFSPKRASFLCYQDDLDIVVENLGKEIQVQKLRPKGGDAPPDLTAGLVKVSLKIDLHELIEFACRYPKKIFILHPESAAKRQKALYRSHLEVWDMLEKLGVC